mgnify:CR=1 FL=1
MSEFMKKIRRAQVPHAMKLLSMAILIAAIYGLVAFLVHEGKPANDITVILVFGVLIAVYGGFVAWCIVSFWAGIVSWTFGLSFTAETVMKLPKRVGIFLYKLAFSTWWKRTRR